MLEVLIELQLLIFGDFDQRKPVRFLEPLWALHGLQLKF